MTELKVGDFVKLPKPDRAGETHGVVRHVKPNGRVWVTNMNMPFSGITSDFFDSQDLTKVGR